MRFVLLGSDTSPLQLRQASHLSETLGLIRLEIDAGREVVGRKIAVWKPKAGIWRNGAVSDFNNSNLRHMVSTLRLLALHKNTLTVL